MLGSEIGTVTQGFHHSVEMQDQNTTKWAICLEKDMQCFFQIHIMSILIDLFLRFSIDY